MNSNDLSDAPTDAVPNRAGRRAAGHRARKIAALGSGAVLAGSAGAAVMTVTSATTAGALTTFTVDNNNDAGAGSLRQAVDDATADADASEIVFASTVTGTITLTTGRLEVDGGGDLTVKGPGAGTLTVNGDANDNIFYSDGSFNAYTLSISGLTLTNGDTGDNGGAIEFYNDSTDAMNLVLTNMVISGNTAGVDGGGVYFYSDGNLTVTNSTIADNVAGEDGGAVTFYDGNSLTITDSTISGNTAESAGGGLYFYGQSAVIANSTFFDNHAGSNGGAISVFGVDLTLLQTTISGNTADGLGDGLYLAGPDAVPNAAAAPEARGSETDPKPPKVKDKVRAQEAGAVTLTGTIVSANGETDIDTNSTATVGSISSLLGTKGAGITINDGGGTITSSTPGLAALADNGGFTKTMALLPGSAAIDAGPDPVPAFTGNEFDQRGAGYPRIVNGRVDIGAYELQSITITPRFTG